MSDLLNLIKEIAERTSKLEKGVVTPDINALVVEVVKKQIEARPQRRMVFETPLEMDPRLEPLQKRMIAPATNDMDREMQKLNDDLYLTSTILKTHPTQLKMWKNFQSQGTELKKALDTATAGDGYEWIPTGFSASLIDLVRIQLRVSALFRRITMPTNPYKFPIVSSDATGYLQTESIADEATKLRASTPQTTNLELSAVKLAARTLFSEEISEDSIVPILPWVKDQIALALATAEEMALINGDTTSTHMDTNVSAAYDCRKAWDGLRDIGLNGGASATVDISTLTIENLRTIRKKMGKYGIDPSKVAMIVGLSGYIQLLSLKDSNSVQLVTTIDKYGPNATILSGELGKLDGIPVIVSQYIYENQGATGLYSASLTKTSMLYVYTPAFIIGDRRRVTVKTAADIETDQQIVVATQRLDFHPFYPVTEAMVGIGYNLAA